MMGPVLAPGSLLVGRYRIQSFIGASELGEVYAALDLQGGRECAVKVLASVLRQAPHAWNAFQDLSRSVAALDADAIARAADFGLDTTVGRPFVVSERVGFPSVATLVTTVGAQPLASWARALSAFSHSFDAAARAGVAHGDIKPNNLFFSPEHPSWARISDFGMGALRAACLSSSSAAPLGWAAIEQSRGAPPSPAGDVFALGLVTYYVLTARHYLNSMWHAAPAPEQVLAELAAEHPAASSRARAQGGELPPALDAWFARALNPDPSARFASAGEAAQALLEQSARTEPLLSTEPARTGVAAAVAEPLIFQDLPRANSSPARNEAPLSSRPPGFAAPRAATTEYVAGLPTRAPVALLAAVGVGLVATLAIAGFAIVRLLSNAGAGPVASSSAALPATAVPAPAPAEPATAAPPSALPSANAKGKGRARFACVPQACEWIVCDGENVKKGQLELELEPGKHSCSASRYGFRTAVSEFQVEAGMTAQVTFELLPAKASSAPARAVGPKPVAKAKTASNKTATKASKTATSLQSLQPGKSTSTSTSTSTKASTTAKPIASSKGSTKTR
jgi:serine/threonine-protein kinase